MNTKNLFLLVWAFVCISACTEKQKMTIIQGTVEEKQAERMEGKEVSLYCVGYFMTKRPEAIAKTVVTDGTYRFEIPFEEPMSLVVSISGMSEISLAVCPGEEVIISGYEVTGASEQEKMKLMTNGMLKKRNDGSFSIFSRYKDLVISADSAKNGAELKISPEYSQYLDEIAALNEQHAKAMTQQLKENPNSVWALIGLQSHAGVMQVTEDHYNMLSKELKNGYYGKAFRHHLDSVLLLGKKLPEFTLRDSAGTAHSLSSLLEGNNYLLIDLWASWCAPCRKGIPVIHKLIEKYSKEGIATVNISTDSDRGAWLQALKEEQMTWTNLLDDGTARKVFSISTIPSVYLVKADGTVLFERQFGDGIIMEFKRIFGY